MFRGSFEHSLDEKGRVSIPYKVSRNSYLGMQDDRRDDQLGDRLIVTKFLLDTFCCLDVYLYADWERFDQELNTKPCFDPNFLKLETFYLSSAHKCTRMYCGVDKHSCILTLYI